MLNIEIIKENIQNWTDARNQTSAINFLTSGNGFVITLHDYNNWEEIQPDTINCYLAINEDNKLVVYLVDNITDEEENYSIGENLFEKNFEEYFDNLPDNTSSPLRTNLPPSEADSRITNWVLCSNSWFKHKEKLREEAIPAGQMVQLFTIPFSDLHELFVVRNFEALKATFALKYYENEVIEGYDIEVILAKTEFNNDPEAGISLVKESFADLSTGYPPANMAGKFFNLL